MNRNEKTIGSTPNGCGCDCAQQKESRAIAEQVVPMESQSTITHKFKGNDMNQNEKIREMVSTAYGKAMSATLNGCGCSSSSQRFSSVLIDAAATYGVQTTKGRDGDGVKIHGLRIRIEHEKSWLDAIENEAQAKTCMKDNPLKLKKMNNMKTSSSDPDKEKAISPVFNWEEMGDF